MEEPIDLSAQKKKDWEPIDYSARPKSRVSLFKPAEEEEDDEFVIASTSLIDDSNKELQFLQKYCEILENKKEMWQEEIRKLRKDLSLLKAKRCLKIFPTLSMLKDSDAEFLLKLPDFERVFEVAKDFYETSDEYNYVTNINQLKKSVEEQDAELEKQCLWLKIQNEVDELV